MMKNQVEPNNPCQSNQFIHASFLFDWISASHFHSFRFLWQSQWLLTNLHCTTLFNLYCVVCWTKKNSIAGWCTVPTPYTSLIHVHNSLFNWRNAEAKRDCSWNLQINTWSNKLMIVLINQFHKWRRRNYSFIHSITHTHAAHPWIACIYNT